MQMTRDCRVVTISTNKMMISVMAEFNLAAAREFLLTIVFTVTVLLIKQSNTTKFTQYNPFSPGYSINTVSLDHIDVYLVRIKRSAMCVLIRAKRDPPQTRDNVLAKVDRNPFLSDVKLKALGVNDQVSSWIEAWLRDRRQRVVVSGETSVWSAVSSGVPQGSILGPLLFIVYINDLDEKMTSTVLKFADDTKITSNSQQELQRDLDTAVKWAQTWQMQFNTSKSGYFLGIIRYGPMGPCH